VSAIASQRRHVHQGVLNACVLLADYVDAVKIDACGRLEESGSSRSSRPLLQRPICAASSAYCRLLSSAVRKVPRHVGHVHSDACVNI